MFIFIVIIFDSRHEYSNSCQHYEADPPFLLLRLCYLAFYTRSPPRFSSGTLAIEAQIGEDPGGYKTTTEVHIAMRSSEN